MLKKKCKKPQQEFKTWPIYQVSKKPKVWKMKLGMDALEERNYVRAPLVQPLKLTINI